MHRKLCRFQFLITLLVLLEFSRLNTYNASQYLIPDLDLYHKKFQRHKVQSLRNLIEQKNMNPDQAKTHRSRRKRKLIAKKKTANKRKSKERNLRDQSTHRKTKSHRKNHNSKRNSRLSKHSKKHAKSRHLSVQHLKRKPKISRALKVAMSNYYTDVARRRLMMPLPPSEASVAAVQAPGVVNSRFVVNSVGVPPSSWYQEGVAPVGYGKPDKEARVIVQRFKLPGNTPVYKNKLLV